MEMLVEQWIAVLFVILTTVNKLFGGTQLFKNIYKHIAWYTKGKIVVIVYVHSHMTITVLLVHDCVWQQKHFCLLRYDTNATLLSSPTHLFIPNYPLLTLQPNFSINSSQEHSLSFSRQFLNPMPLHRTTPLVHLLLHIDTSRNLSNVLNCSAHFSAHPTLYTHNSFCVWHPFHILHQLPLAIPGT